MAICLTIQTGGALKVATNPSPASCTGYIALQRDEYEHYQSLYQASIAPYDYLNGAAIFGFFFTFTVGLWMVSRSAGEIMSAVKRF